MLGKNVLYIEDDPLVLEAYVRFFEKCGADIVQTAHTKKEGLDKFAKHRFDIVVIDVNLPDGDGIELCKKIRVLPRGNAIPIINLTGERQELNDLSKGYEYGADQYVVRPIAPATLQAIIEGLLKKYERIETDAKSVLIADPTKMCVLLDGKESCELTAIEFRILSCLLSSSPNDKVTSEMLMSAVWNESRFNKKLSVHISRLNVKLRIIGFMVRAEKGETYTLHKTELPILS